MVLLICSKCEREFLEEDDRHDTHLQYFLCGRCKNPPKPAIKIIQKQPENDLLKNFNNQENTWLLNTI